MRILVGRVGRAHGVRGDVGVDVRTDDPDVRFAAGAVLHASDEGPATVTVSRSRWHSGRLLVAFEGITDRTAAERLQGTQLYREEADTVAEADAWYDYDLVGCEVFSGGAPVGRVAEVLHLPAQDCLAVEVADGSVRLVPMVVDIVTEVDPQHRRIVVDDLPGLLSDLPDDK